VCADLLCSAITHLRTSQAVLFQTEFLLINSIVHAIVDDAFSLLRDVSQIPGSLRMRQIAASVGHFKTEFSASVGFARGPRWGLRPQTSVIGARHVCPPYIFLTWRRPWLATCPVPTAVTVL